MAIVNGEISREASTGGYKLFSLGRTGKLEQVFFYAEKKESLEVFGFDGFCYPVFSCSSRGDVFRQVDLAVEEPGIEIVVGRREIIYKSPEEKKIFRDNAHVIFEE